MRKSASRTTLDVLPVVEPVATGRPPRHSASGMFLGERQPPKKWATFADTFIVLVCVLAVSVLVWLYAVHKLYLGHVHDAPVYSPTVLRHQSDMLRHDVDAFDHFQE